MNNEDRRHGSFDNIRYGDVVWVNLGEAFGSEQGGIRPAMVISNDKNNMFSPKVSIAPISSSVNKRTNKAYLPTHIPISPNEDGVTGLSRESVILCEETKPVDKSRIIDKSGHISNACIINKLNKALTIQYNMV